MKSKTLQTNSKLRVINRIDDLLSLMNKPKSNYDLIINSLSLEQLNYYLQLTKDDVYYENIQ